MDDEQLEREFEELEREHYTCCTGAVLWDGSWVNLLAPIDDPDYRPFQHETDVLRRRRAYCN